MQNQTQIKLLIIIFAAFFSLKCPYIQQRVLDQVDKNLEETKNLSYLELFCSDRFTQTFTFIYKGTSQNFLDFEVNFFVDTKITYKQKQYEKLF